MDWTQTTAYQIAEWLKAQFNAPHVELDDHFDSDSVLFYIDAPDVIPRPVFQISEEVLDDLDAAAIADTLTRQDVVTRLRRDPTMRLFLDSTGEVAQVESRLVECDGRIYRIVRDSSHSVRIFDDVDRPLDKLPPAILVMPDSIHLKSVLRWREEIRQWRGPNQ